MKKNVSRFLTMALGLGLLSLPVMSQTGSKGSMGEGQGRHHHGMRTADEQLEHLTKALNLSADQQAKIKPILQDQHSQIESLKQNTSMSKEDRHGKFKQIRQETHQKIRDVLIDDQKAKFAEMQARHKEHMGKHGNHGDTGMSEKSEKQ